MCGGWGGRVLALVVKYLRNFRLKKGGGFSNVGFVSVVCISKSGLEFSKKIFDKKSLFFAQLPIISQLCLGNAREATGKPLLIPEKIVVARICTRSISRRF